MKDSNAIFKFKNDHLHTMVFEEKNSKGKWQTYKTLKWTNEGYRVKDLREEHTVTKEKRESRKDWKFSLPDGSAYWF